MLLSQTFRGSSVSIALENERCASSSSKIFKVPNFGRWILIWNYWKQILDFWDRKFTPTFRTKLGYLTVIFKVPCVISFHNWLDTREQIAPYKPCFNLITAQNIFRYLDRLIGQQMTCLLENIPIGSLQNDNNFALKLSAPKGFCIVSGLGYDCFEHWPSIMHCVTLSEGVIDLWMAFLAPFYAFLGKIHDNSASDWAIWPG